jgi:hypothetical protein
LLHQGLTFSACQQFKDGFYLTQTDFGFGKLTFQLVKQIAIVKINREVVTGLPFLCLPDKK